MWMMPLHLQVNQKSDYDDDDDDDDTPLFIRIAYLEFLLHFVMLPIKFKLHFWIIYLGKNANMLTN